MYFLGAGWFQTGVLCGFSSDVELLTELLPDAHSGFARAVASEGKWVKLCNLGESEI